MPHSTITTMDVYQQRAMETEASQEEILERFLNLTKSTQVEWIRLLNAVHGLTDEVGEINSAVKKAFEYGKDLDVDNLKEEVGDCLWRLSQICKACGFSLEEAANANIIKLQQVRYKNGFSNHDAHNENRDRDAEAACMSGIDPASGESQTMFSVRCPQCGDLSCDNFGSIYFCSCGYTWSHSSNSDNPSPQDIESELREQTGQGWSEPPYESEEPLVEFSRTAVDMLEGQDRRIMQGKLDQILKGGRD